MRKRALPILGVVLLTLGLLGSATSGAFAAGSAKPKAFNAREYLRLHGYLPLDGVAKLRAAKAHAAAVVAAQHGVSAPASPVAGAAPTIGSSWQGIADASLSPLDSNGAIGPSSYIEIINSKIAIYTRAGGTTASANLSSLTGHSQGNLSDPMILWDPDTQRFFYNVWDFSNNSMAWGFSKTANPTAIPSSFCNYTTGFGYPSGSFADYPKLGQTKNFLMIGINFYPTPTSQHATSQDLLWITKQQGQGSITTCPAASNFKSGKFTGLKNQDGSQAFTPVPAIQTDPNKKGFVLASSDIECPDICGTGTKVTVFTLKPSAGDPTVPSLSGGKSLTVGSFESPPDAPQKGSVRPLDTLDGRLEHAVSAIDPATGKVEVWTSHAVLSATGSEERWYEIDPKPLSLTKSGVATSASLYVFNGAISPDRTCTATQCVHGGSMVMGFNTSSSTQFPAIQMVSKVGAGAQSAFVMVKQSTTADVDFTCNLLGTCRWGDYGGATPDPAANIGNANGEVWLTNDWTNGDDASWNWEALP